MSKTPKTKRSFSLSQTAIDKLERHGGQNHSAYVERLLLGYEANPIPTLSRDELYRITFAAEFQAATVRKDRSCFAWQGHLWALDRNSNGQRSVWLKPLSTLEAWGLRTDSRLTWPMGLENNPANVSQMILIFQAVSGRRFKAIEPFHCSDRELRMAKEVVSLASGSSRELNQLWINKARSMGLQLNP
jgi:hypothetical protein